MESLFQFVLGLAALSFLVFIHEWGHFIVARMTGVKVHTFSIGFGPKLIQKKIGDTVWCLSAIPFGGYVAMSGEAAKEAKSQGYADGDFRGKSIWARGAIALGGPMVNIIFAFLALFFMYMIGVQEPVKGKLVVGRVNMESPALLAGFAEGDTLLSLEGEDVKTWRGVLESAAMSIDQEMKFTVLRGSDTLIIRPTPVVMEEYGLGYLGLAPQGQTMVPANPELGTPAWNAGLRKGDTLLQIESELITSPTVLINIVSKSEGRELKLIIARDGNSNKETKIKAEETPEGWRIGLPLGQISNIPTEEVKRSVGESFVVAWDRGIDMAKAPFKFIQKIFNGGIQLKAMSGPIGIVQIMGKTTQAGFIEFILLLALISMNLGIMNLLPLAITDGGILMFLTLEFFRKKPLPVKVEAKIQQVATLFFISLFLYITFQDVLRFPTLW